MKIVNCPLCHEEIISEIGKNCKMCGMDLEDESRDFCSKTCRTKYSQIRKDLS